MFKPHTKKLFTDPSQPNIPTNRVNIFHTLPYNSLTSPSTKQWHNIIRQSNTNLKVHLTFKPAPNIYSQLQKINTHYSTPTPIGIVYGMTCPQCQKNDNKPYHYIGETSSTLQKRIYNHYKDLANTSAIRDHMQSTGHKDFNYKILHTNNIATQRKIIEAIFIKKYNPTLNLNRGTHFYCSQH